MIVKNGTIEAEVLFETPFTNVNYKGVASRAYGFRKAMPTAFLSVNAIGFRWQIVSLSSD
jgi:hypothetical protein